MCAFSIAAIISSDIILLLALISPSTSPVATDAAAVGGSGREGSGATADASERISGGVVSIVLDVNLCALKHHLIFASKLVAVRGLLSLSLAADVTPRARATGHLDLGGGGGPVAN